MFEKLKLKLNLKRTFKGQLNLLLKSINEWLEKAKALMLENLK